MDIPTSNTLEQAQRRKIKKTALWLIITVIVMFGFGYAMVPLYDVVCQAFGIGGRTSTTPTANKAVIDTSRWITVEVLATKNGNLSWKFYPLIKKVRIHPGQNKLISYFAENDSHKIMTVQAVPSVTPAIAANYLMKTECFCFNRQTLASGKSIAMVVIFYIDPTHPTNIKTITLSYTLFDASGLKKKKQIANLKGRIR